MAHKHLLFHSAAREKILRGTSALADAVRVTLGPKSKSVLIEKKWGAPIVCNDGVTIAKEVDLKDPEENLGAQILRQAAEKTGDAVGDPVEPCGRSMPAWTYWIRLPACMRSACTRRVRVERPGKGTRTSMFPASRKMRASMHDNSPSGF